jgi:SAM-dependent methyltransferase
LRVKEMPALPINNTTEFYERNADQFCGSTSGLNMESLYDRFLKLLPKAGMILDAGCGSGRDTRAFKARGFHVTAIDSSRRVVQFAREFTGQKCRRLRLQDIEFHEKFDGIWACASLLHLRKREIADVMFRLIDALKAGGVMYVSLKEGRGERIAEDGRFFNYYTLTSLRRLLSEFSNVDELAIWKTRDIRPGRHGAHWLNALVRKI